MNMEKKPEVLNNKLRPSLKTSLKLPVQNGFHIEEEPEEDVHLTPLGGITTITNGHHIYHAVNADPDWKIKMQAYSTYITQPIQLANTDVSFYIEPNDDKTPFELKQFAIRVSAPTTNLTHDVHASQADYQDESYFNRRRFKFTFRPTEAGRYPGIVSLRSPRHFGLGQHISGSPLTITVARNYSEDMKEAIKVRMVVETSLDPTASTWKMPMPLSIKNLPIWSALTSAGLPLSGMHCYNPSKVGLPALLIPTDPVKCKPWGITYCPRTNEIFLAVRDNHEIQKFLVSSGKFVGRFGQLGHEPGNLYRPTGITYDGTHDRLVISDKDNHRICFFTVAGLFMSTFGSVGHLDGEFCYPWGIDVSKNGHHIVVADSRNHRIQVFNEFGCFINKYSVFERDPFEYKHVFNYPRAVCFDNSGKHIYVSDFNLNHVFKLDFACTTQVPLINGVLLRPQGLAVDPAGNVIICDSKNNFLRVVGSTGSLLTTIREFGAIIGPDSAPSPDSDKLETPTDVCLLNAGKIAILDATGVIRVF